MEGICVRNRACVVCGKPFAERGRIDRMYCLDGGCRTLAWKKRKRAISGASLPGTEVAGGSPVSSPENTPYGALVQLAQHLESELSSTRRALAAAEQCIVELRSEQREGYAAAARPLEEAKAPKNEQTPTACAAVDRLGELQGDICALRKEIAELKLLLQEAHGHQGECQAQRGGASGVKVLAEESAKAVERPSVPAPLPTREQAYQREQQQQTDVPSRLTADEEGTTGAVQSADSAQGQARAAAEALLVQAREYAEASTAFPQPIGRSNPGLAAAAPASTAAAESVPTVPLPQPAPEGKPMAPPVAAQAAAPQVSAATGTIGRTHPGLAGVAPASTAAAHPAPTVPMPHSAPEGVLVPQYSEAAGALKVQRTHRLLK